jgi:hypothetical protein
MRKDPILSTASFSIADQEAWTAFGFKFGEKGAHTSRTIMFEEYPACYSIVARRQLAKITSRRSRKKTALANARYPRGNSQCSGFQNCTHWILQSHFSGAFGFLGCGRKALAQLAILTALARDPYYVPLLQLFWLRQKVKISPASALLKRSDKPLKVD